jgi:hypothetical protein
LKGDGIGARALDITKDRLHSITCVIPILCGGGANFMSGAVYAVSAVYAV